MRGLGKILIITVLWVIGVLPVAAQSEAPEPVYAEGDGFSFAYPGEMRLLTGPESEAVQLRLDLDRLEIFVQTEAGFTQWQHDGLDLSPEQTPLEMMRNLVTGLNAMDELDATLEDVRELTLSDGRVGLLLEGWEDDQHLYLLSFPLADGRTWLIASAYEHPIMAEAAHALLLAIAESIQPLSDFNSPDNITLPGIYEAETIGLRYPAGMEIDQSDNGLLLESDGIDFNLAIVNPQGFDMLRAEGVEIDQSMPPQAMMIAFVRGINAELAAEVSLEDVRSIELSDGRPALLLEHTLPEERDSILLLTFATADESTWLAGVSVSGTPPLVSDLLNAQARQMLLDIVESITPISE